MILFWKWKELYVGNSLSRFTAIRSALSDKGIQYSAKQKRHDENPPLRSPARETLGRVGENSELATMYYVFVRKSDFDAAENAIRDIR